MTKSTRRKGVFQRFCGNARGGLTLVFALAMIPMLIAAGVAIDYLRAKRVETDLLSALDAAVLAVARAEGRPNAERIAEGLKYFNINFQSSELQARIVPDIKIGPQKIRASAKGFMPTSFMRITAINTMAVVAESQALRPTAGRAEVVLVLDYSGSMNDGNKYGRMATVAQDFITQLSSDLSSLASLKFAVVPFSDMVAVNLPASEWGNGNTGWGCTQDRKRPYTSSSDGATGDPDSKWYDPHDIYGGSFTAAACTNFRAKGLDTISLTNNYSMVKTRIAAMRPFTNTHVALGAEMGFHLLSHDSPYPEAEDFGTPGVHKFIIILSDGMQTTPGYGLGGATDDPAPADQIMPNADVNLQAVCSAMKDPAKGVSVFTIGYDLDPAVAQEAHALTNLQNCAAPGKFFDAAAVGTDLKVTFNEIAEAIKASMIYLSQ